MECEIVTIYSLNYGNRLQNYALQEVLKQFGYITTTNYVEEKPLGRKIKNRLKAFRNKSIQDYYAKFDLQNIAFRYVKQEKMYDESIDYYIAGSDQIWNPNFSFNSEREFLDFAPGRKKIAYAASIGVSELLEEQKDWFVQYLPDFKAISVREYDAATLLKNTVDNIETPEVVVDPTMLLTVEQWEKIENQSQLRIEEPYVIKYFLGIRNDEVEKKIEAFCRGKGYKLIDITKSNIGVIGPAEFIYLLKNSEFNFVDSFHGTVFSILFNKSFYTFERPGEAGFGNMNSRFDTIVSMFEVQNRYIRDFDSFEITKEIDFRKVNELLEYKRENSLLFLKKALEVPIDGKN